LFSEDTDSLVKDSNGNFYLADTGNHVIRKITPAGVVSTFAGIATDSGFKNGPALESRFNSPVGLAIDPNGANPETLVLYVADSLNHRIRKVSCNGTTNCTVTTLTGSGTAGYRDSTIGTPSFNGPSSLAISSNGESLYVSEGSSNRIRKVSISNSSVTVSTIASGFTGALALYQDRYLYVAGQSDHTIRRIDLLSVGAGGLPPVVIAAGSRGVAGREGGTAASSRFTFPSSLFIDGNTLYIGEKGAIRKATISAGNGTLSNISSVAGSTGTVGTRNGPGQDALFIFPLGIAKNGGDLIISDQGSKMLRKIDLP
jgi:hypothetical protein